jgi:phage/plasmid-like protein (TIGR03299 family)
MPHNLEQYGDGTSFAYNGAENPWHRLGVKMDGLATAEDMLIASRADYTVTSEPLYVMTESGAVEVPGRRATVRSVEADDDRDPSSCVLGVVGESYRIVQNRDVLNRALAVVSADGKAVVDTCGVLGHGERFFAYIDLGHMSIDPNGIDDKITRGLGVLTSHDGTAAVTYAMSNIRWVCQNTVTAGLNAATRTFRARHTTNVESMLVDAQTVLSIADTWEQTFSQLAERLLRVNDGSNSAKAHDIMRRVEGILWPMGDEPSRHADLWPMGNEPSRHAETISETRSMELHSLLDSDTCGNGFGYSGWAIYNAFVEYSDHVRPRLSDERRAEATILGLTDDWKNKVANLVLSVG